MVLQKQKQMTHPLVKLAPVVGALAAQVVYLIAVLVLLLQEAAHLVYMVPVDALQLLRGEAHRDQPVCYI